MIVIDRCFTCVLARESACVHICGCDFMSVCMYVYMYVCMYVRVYVYVCRDVEEDSLSHSMVTDLVSLKNGVKDL